ncbi:RAxF-45 family protein [Paenibacillus sp. JX-17]|uniref:RAxF-45 family protein n=1 Tax=Paenibacillus lacisoli TaxID=3064525 RepID=A0ABT9CAT0_9BACL|nr:RAxF-45 family protein [Paenibacillus sp. JX-17]MDO7906363.1 RAxF-45 family protein [Paenibacillus sp. JX-17]
MNSQKVNDRISQLPIAMAGIVHAFADNGRSLSIFDYTVTPHARRRLP